MVLFPLFLSVLCVILFFILHFFESAESTALTAFYWAIGLFAYFLEFGVPFSGIFALIKWYRSDSGNGCGKSLRKKIIFILFIIIFFVWIGSSILFVLNNIYNVPLN